MVTLHLLAVVLTLLAVVYADHQGFLWLRGRTPVLSRRRVEVLHALVGVGLSGIILTGGLMFLDRSAYLLSQPEFIIKMCFVAALVVNGLCIGRVVHLASEKPFAELTESERQRVFISGAVSAVSWLGALLCGLILTRF